MTSQRREVRCRLIFRNSCPQMYLADYLQGIENQQKNELVLKATKAFWLPIALEEAEVYSTKKVARFYLDAIEQLKSQIWHLQQLLRVNHQVEIDPFNFSSNSSTNNIGDEELEVLDEEEEFESEPLSEEDCDRGNFGF